MMNSERTPWEKLYSHMFGIDTKYVEGSHQYTIFFFLDKTSLTKDNIGSFLVAAKKIGYSYEIDGHTGKDSDRLDQLDHAALQKYKWIYIHFEHSKLYTPLIKITHSKKVGWIASIFFESKGITWDAARDGWLDLARAFANNFPFRFCFSAPDIMEEVISDIGGANDIFRHPGKEFVNVMAWGNEFLDKKTEKLLLNAPAYSVTRLKYGIFMEVFPFLGVRDDEEYHDLPNEYYKKVKDYFSANVDGE